MHPDGGTEFQVKRPFAGCPDAPVLSAYLDGEVERPWLDLITAHAGTCTACRERLDRLQKVRDALQADPEPQTDLPADRVRSRLAAAQWQKPSSLWQRQVAFPMPVVAMAAVLFVFLGMSLVLSLSRDAVGLVRIKSAPLGVTEVQISASPRDLEKLLLALEKGTAAQEEVVKLPSDQRFNRLSAPLFIKEKDLAEKKTW